MQTVFQNLLNGIAAGSIYALIALGYTMVYGILKLINFAHGDIFMIGSFVGFYTGNYLAKNNADAPSLVNASIAMLLSMIICGFLGYLNERIAYRPLRNAPRIASLITAIGVSFLLEYGGQFVFGPDPKFFPTLVEKKLIHIGGVVTTNYQLIVLGVAIVFMALLQYIVYGTKFGRAMRAVSFNFETASLMGIPTDRIITMTFVLGSMLAAVAGILYGLSYPEDRSADGHHARAEGVRRRGPRRHRERARRRRRRPGHRHRRGLRRRLAVLELPRRDRVHHPHRHPAVQAFRPVRQVRAGEGLMQRTECKTDN